MDSFIVINKKSKLEQYINSIFEIHEYLLKKNNYNEIKKLKQIYDIDKLIFYNLFKMKPNLNLSSIFIYEFIELSTYNETALSDSNGTNLFDLSMI